jgi:hypothetical protein
VDFAKVNVDGNAVVSLESFQFTAFALNVTFHIVSGSFKMLKPS